MLRLCYNSSLRQEHLCKEYHYIIDFPAGFGICSSWFLASMQCNHPSRLATNRQSQSAPCSISARRMVAVFRLVMRYYPKASPAQVNCAPMAAQEALHCRMRLLLYVVYQIVENSCLTHTRRDAIYF